MLFKGTTELGTLDWQKEKPWIDKTFALYDLLAAAKDDIEWSLTWDNPIYW